jgi:hypothetical protein
MTWVLAVLADVLSLATNIPVAMVEVPEHALVDAVAGVILLVTGLHLCLLSGHRRTRCNDWDGRKVAVG